MDSLAAEISDQKISSVFIYTHEAHPGEKVPHHTSFKQKLRHAALMRDVAGVQRPILVDAIDGACHRFFGSMPNMTWIISRAGIAVYKSDWTDSESLRRTIRDLDDMTAERKRTRVPTAPFRVERLEYRQRDRKAFIHWLEEHAGPKAVAEYTAVFGRK